jgi:hypothetical protein
VIVSPSHRTEDTQIASFVCLHNVPYRGTMHLENV